MGELIFTPLKNRFIAIEGIDGSGKSTQAKMLANALEKRGMAVHLTAEPTKGPIGRMIREIFAGKMAVDEHSIAALFVADRIEHLKNEQDGMMKKLDERSIVITDRYYFSSYAYHGVHVDMSWVIAMNSVCAAIRRPDITIFIDTPPEAAMERLLASRGDLERYETLANLQKVRAKYLEAFEILKIDEKILMIDGNRPPDMVHQEIMQILD